jgi:hypothetical protein
MELAIVLPVRSISNVPRLTEHLRRRLSGKWMFGQMTTSSVVAIGRQKPQIGAEADNCLKLLLKLSR